MPIVGYHRRSAFYAVLLLALLVRSMMPVGFMPGQSKDGTVQMVICTGHGPMNMAVDADKSPLPLHHQSGDHSCPFASVLAQDAPTLPIVLVPVPRYENVRLYTQSAFMLDGIAFKPWFSQGPPVS